MPPEQLFRNASKPMTMTNRISTFALAALIAAFPAYAFAHDDAKERERRDDRSQSGVLVNLRNDVRGFFGDFGPRGNDDRTHDRRTEDRTPQKQHTVRAEASTETRIEARIDNLEALIDRIESSSRLSSQEKARITAGIEAQIDLLQGMLARVAGGESWTNINLNLKTELKGRVHAAPKAAITAAGERALRIVERTETLAARLKARIDTAEDDGDDVDASLRAHANLIARLNDAETHANAAIRLVADLSLDTSDDNAIARNRQALLDARGRIEGAYASLKAAREEIRFILNDLNIGFTAQADLKVKTKAKAGVR